MVIKVRDVLGEPIMGYGRSSVFSIGNKLKYKPYYSKEGIKCYLVQYVVDGRLTSVLFFVV